MFKVLKYLPRMQYRPKIFPLQDYVPPTKVPLLTDSLSFIKGKPFVTEAQPYALLFFSSNSEMSLISLSFWTRICRKYPFVKFLAISTSDAEDRIVSFMSTDDTSIPYDIACDTNGKWNSFYLDVSTSGLPHVVVVDMDQIIFNGHLLDPDFEKTIEYINFPHTTDKFNKYIQFKNKTFDYIRGMSVAELQDQLDARDIKHEDCHTHAHYVYRVAEALGCKDRKFPIVPEVTEFDLG